MIGLPELQRRNSATAQCCTRIRPSSVQLSRTQLPSWVIMSSTPRSRQVLGRKCGSCSTDGISVVGAALAWSTTMGGSRESGRSSGMK